MPAFVSPLDGNYISLKRAALLTAQEQPGIVPDDIMDLFKHALFAREFERPEVAVQGIEPAEDWNFPLLLIEVPPPNQTARHLPLEQQPQEYFAVNSVTIAEVLSEREALPGKMEDWTAFIEFPRDANKALHDLARIPYAAFPAKAQDILGHILLAKIKLRLWMAWKGYALPNFLKDIALPAQKPSPIALAEPQGEETDVSRGRPRKAGWLRIGQLVRELRATRPESKHTALAADAYEKAKKEFDEKDLPSVETIARQMKNILAARG